MAKTANRFLSALLAFLMIFQLCGFSSVTALAEEETGTEAEESVVILPDSEVETPVEEPTEEPTAELPGELTRIDDRVDFRDPGEVGETQASKIAAYIDGYPFATLEEAVAAIGTEEVDDETGDTFVFGSTIELAKDYTLSDILVLSGGKTVILDLNDKTLTGDIDAYDVDLTILDGTVKGTVYVNGLPSGQTGSLTVAANATIESGYAIILYQADDNTGNGYTVDLNGTVNGIVWVMGNIKEGDSVINVNSGAKISGDDVGIALNGYATVNVNDGAEISGTATGIEVRAGVLNVTGGTITGDSTTETTVNADGSGTTTSGAGIAVAQHTTKLPIEVNVTGGIISGYTAFYESNPQNNSADDLAKIQVSITGGSFIGVDEAIHANDLTGFVSAVVDSEGTFTSRPWASSKIDAAYVTDGFFPSDEMEHDPAYTVSNERTVTFDPDNGEEKTTVSVMIGSKVEKPASDPEKEGYTFKFWSADGENAFDFETVITEDLTLTAIWTEEKYTVTVSSAGGSLDGPTVAHVQGGGVFSFGESTTLVAPEVDGYTFAGWYRDGSLVSTEPTYEFTLTSASSNTIAFIALYQPVKAGLFRLEVTGSKFKVSNMNATQRSYFDDWYTADTKVTVTFVGSSDETFLYWVNGNGKIMSTSPEYTFYMVTHTELHAVYSDSDTSGSEALVVFVNNQSNGQVLVSHYYTSNETIVFPDAPVSMGREFVGWTMTETQIKEAMATESKIVVYARYISSSEYCVIVKNNLNGDQVVTDPIASGKECTIEADESLGSFSYWMWNGKIISYTPSLVVRSNDKNIELTAVYNEEAEPVPVITMTDSFGTQLDGRYGLTFVATRSVPEGWTVARQGILYTNRTDLDGKDLTKELVIGGNVE